MKTIRIGLGCTLLERAMNGYPLDGIGVYTRHLRDALLRTPGAHVVPACFPPKPWQPALPNHYPGRYAFGMAYGLSAAIARLTSLPFAGGARLARDIDLYHAPDHLIPRLEKVPVVATVCDALVVQRPDWIDAGPGAFRSALFKSSVAWARRVIAISQAMVPDLVEHFGVPRESISVVHMGIAPEWFEPLDEEQRGAVMRKYGLTPGYYLFVGTLQPRKNVERIVAAHAALPDELRRARKLVVAGKAGWGSEALAGKLRSLRADGACAWLEYVPADELRALYQCAGAFVFPSLWEGFGMPVLEAFASGVPVVASNVSSLPEVAGEAALLVDPRSVAEIRDAMERLAEDRGLVASLVQKGRVRALGMSWDTCARKTLAVYQQAM